LRCGRNQLIGSEGLIKGEQVIGGGEDVTICLHNGLIKKWRIEVFTIAFEISVRPVCQY